MPRWAAGPGPFDRAVGSADNAAVSGEPFGDGGARPGLLLPGRSARPGGYSFEEAARRIGRFRWVETRLFEMLGSWVATVPEPGAKVVLARHAHHHAWHAELWRERLPRVREADPGGLAPPAEDAFVRFVDAVREPEAPEHTIEKLVGVYRVLIPRLIGAYTEHLDGAGAIADAPTIRSLRFVLQDELEDWRDGEMLIHSLIDTTDKARRAARRQEELEALYVVSGGVAGPPDRPVEGDPAAPLAAPPAG